MYEETEVICITLRIQAFSEIRVFGTRVEDKGVDRIRNLINVRRYLNLWSEIGRIIQKGTVQGGVKVLSISLGLLLNILHLTIQMTGKDKAT